MATPAAVAIFIEVTGAPSSIAMQFLEKHGGNLTDAINSYFLEEDTHKLWSQEQQNLAASASQHDNPGASNQDPLAQSSASHVPDDEKEEEIVEAAMQDSKTDTAGASSSQQMDVLKDSPDHELPQSHSQQEEDDYDLSRAVLMSLKDLDDPVSPTAERNNISNSLSSDQEEELCQMILREYRKRAQVFTIAVRMPDGRRIDRHFLKTDKLKDLFDFVDIAGFGEYLSGTYRLVKQFPRRGYSIEDSSSTFDEVGLSDDEALYVEKI